MNRPLVSVITVVYNASSTLEATIKSVLSQDEQLVEYIIIDGGSTDGSLDIIRKYENQLASWSSEPDYGIYDAMNKGIERAKGEWIYFLGGDDTMRKDIVTKIRPYLKKSYAIVFGNVLFDNGYLYRSQLGKRTILQNTLHHQSAFYNISLFDKYRYDPSLTVVSEYDLHLNLYLKKQPIHYVPLIIADCATGGASSELSRSLVQTNRVRARHIKSKWKNTLFSSILSLYYMQKRVRFIIYGHRV